MLGHERRAAAECRPGSPPIEASANWRSAERSCAVRVGFPPANAPHSLSHRFGWKTAVSGRGERRSMNPGRPLARRRSCAPGFARGQGRPGRVREAIRIDQVDVGSHESSGRLARRRFTRRGSLKRRNFKQLSANNNIQSENGRLAQRPPHNEKPGTDRCAIPDRKPPIFLGKKDLILTIGLTRNRE